MAIIDCKAMHAAECNVYIRVILGTSMKNKTHPSWATQGVRGHVLTFSRLRNDRNNDSRKNLSSYCIPETGYFLWWYGCRKTTITPWLSDSTRPATRTLGLWRSRRLKKYSHKNHTILIALRSLSATGVFQSNAVRTFQQRHRSP